MNRLYYFLLLILCISGCEVDNFDPPSTILNGRLVFDGQPVGIRQGISVLQLYQPGYENKTPIAVNVKQDGSFSSILFDGTYKMIRIAGNGPWENNPDTITIEVKGPTTADVPITPFFSISDVSFSVVNGVLTAHCTVNNNVAGRQLESVSLLVGKTNLVDHIYRLTPAAATSIRNGPQINEGEPVVLQQDLAPFSKEPYLFARIGIKTVGHPELIYSTVWTIR